MRNAWWFLPLLLVASMCALAAEPPAVGARVPDLTVYSGHGGPVKLSDFAGEQNVLLVLLPSDASASALRAACALEADAAVWKDSNTALLLVAPGSPEAAAAWAKQAGLKSYYYDRDGAAARKLALVPAGRATSPTYASAAFLIGHNGLVYWRHLAKAAADLPPIEQLKSALALLPPREQPYVPTEAPVFRG